MGGKASQQKKSAETNHAGSFHSWVVQKATVSVQSVNGIHVCKKSSVGTRLAHLPAGHSWAPEFHRASRHESTKSGYAPTSRFHSHAHASPPQ